MAIESRYFGILPVGPFSLQAEMRKPVRVARVIVLKSRQIFLPALTSDGDKAEGANRIVSTILVQAMRELSLIGLNGNHGSRLATVGRRLLLGVFPGISLMILWKSPALVGSVQQKEFKAPVRPPNPDLP